MKKTVVIGITGQNGSCLAELLIEKNHEVHDIVRCVAIAIDYVRAIWLTLPQEHPDDYMVGTGETRSVREFCQAAFEQVNLHWEDHLETDPRFYRPAEVELLVSDASRTKQILQWEPQVRFRDLVAMMVDASVKRQRGD